MQFISDPYAELPVTFQTVSEFRRRKKLADSTAEEQQPIERNHTETLSNNAEADAQYFDASCNVVVPTSFAAETQPDSTGSSALSQFMSTAVDIQSAFEFADKVGPSVEQQIAAGPQLNFQADPAMLPLPQELTAQPEQTFQPAQPAEFISTMSLQEISVLDAALTSNRTLDQASVLKDPQEISATTIPVETDAAGRVVKSLFCGGECVCFQYDDNGELAEFNYAGMKWTRSEHGWMAKDRQTEYALEGSISVLSNGSIRIEREDVTRILKMSGTRIDEHRSGSRTESRKLKNKPSPYDLLAKAKAVNSIWLNGRGPYKPSSEHSLPAPLKLDLINDTATAEQPTSSSMIPRVAKIPAYVPSVVNEASLTCVPSQPIELRSLEQSTGKLRTMEESLLDTQREQGKASLKMQVTEAVLKSRLWLTDRIVGQSSPKHLEHLDRLAQMYFDRQRYDLAELTHMRALHIREQFYGKGQPELAASVRGLASIYEARSNFLRAEEMYKEAIELQENGLRKILFLFSEKVTDAAKLNAQLEALFGSVSDLSQLYFTQGKQQICAVVYEKALALAAEIVEREPAAKPVLDEATNKHLDAMKDLVAS